MIFQLRLNEENRLSVHLPRDPEQALRTKSKGNPRAPFAFQCGLCLLGNSFLHFFGRFNGCISSVGSLSFDGSGSSFSFSSSGGSSFSSGCFSLSGSFSSLLLHSFGVAASAGNEQGSHYSYQGELLQHLLTGFLFGRGCSGGSSSGSSFSSGNSFSFSSHSSSSISGSNAISSCNGRETVSRGLGLGFDICL